jgi:hypothetical protein
VLGDGGFLFSIMMTKRMMRKKGMIENDGQGSRLEIRVRGSKLGVNSDVALRGGLTEGTVK